MLYPDFKDLDVKRRSGRMNILFFYVLAIVAVIIG
jgi:hypothetical protein